VGGRNIEFLLFCLYRVRLRRTMNGMKLIKRLLQVVLVLVILVAVAVGLIALRGGPIIREGVNRIGPRVLGVPVTLESARFNPLEGQVHLTGLLVGNPEGFRTESLFDLHHFEAAINVRSLLTDTIIIDRILIEAPRITYEMRRGGSNLGVLLAHLEGEPKAAPTPDPDAEPRTKATERTVVIRELVLVDARVDVSATAAGGRTVPVQLSTITLHDLGGPDQDTAAIVAEIVRAIIQASGSAIQASGAAFGDGLDAVIESLDGIGGADGERVRKALDTAADQIRSESERAGERASRLLRGLDSRRQGDGE